MKNLLLVILMALSFGANMYGQQDKFIKHKVAKSETVTQIAKTYSVTPFDIYRLNPDSQAGIRENDILLIPSGKSAAASPSVKTATAATTHLVKPKETLFSIARDFDISVSDLKNANIALLKDGLKSGQTIRIPAGSTAPTQVVVAAAPEPVTVEKQFSTPSTGGVFHVVEPGQTKFSIAKRYGITIEELEHRNPGIVQSLPAGYKLNISGNVNSYSENRVVKPVAVPQEVNAVNMAGRKVYANYEVKPQETLFGLTQMFDITSEELIALNPSLKDGVKIGMILKVPGKGSIVVDLGKGFKDLSASLDNTKKKELVLLLPFNASRIQGDSVKSITERLKKDQFLNMTLDFYSGALLAIDSARTLGLNVNIRILDSQETKFSSGVTSVIQKNNLRNADVVIGPFYQQYLETTAGLLAKDSVAVISPLSKDSGKPFNNLYQTMPSEDFLKSAMFDFMNSKNGNIIVVSDPKKAANREFILKNYKNAKFSPLSETGGFVPSNLKALLVKDRINYVVLDSEKTGMILAVTNLLLNELNNYNIQLAILEQNETLDFEEISMKRLTILKMLYPSVTRDNNSDGANSFAREYKEKNKIFPNQYATRGFDVTFDTLLRLSQGKSFESCMSDDKSEQVESRFNYIRDKEGGFVNKGVYILQYNEDLSVTEAQ